MNEQYDAINPSYYQTDSGLQACDVIEQFTAHLSGAEAINTGQALKYLTRWKRKNGVEDLKKARWYITRLIDLLEGKGGESK